MRTISDQKRLDIRTLIERYMAGETTNEEETTLRQWFRLAGDAVPDEWRPLRAMLSFVDEERDALDKVTESKGNDSDTGEHYKPNRMTLVMRCLHRPRTWISSAVAAAAVGTALLVPRFTSIVGSEPQNYAVIDGKVYTNPKIVKEEAMDALQTVATDDDPFSALNMMQ